MIEERSRIGLLGVQENVAPAIRLAARQKENRMVTRARESRERSLTLARGRELRSLIISGARAATCEHWNLRTLETAQWCYDRPMLPDYAQFDATGLAELVAAKEVSRVELWQSATSAIAALDAELNAVVHQFDPPIERTNSEGPFAGVPFLLKDLHGALFGTPLSMGSRLYQDYRCGADSELVNRLLEAGLVMIGRSNSPEFGLMAATEPVLHGPTKNPWDLRLTAGGSSGGAAAAVASGMVPMAHASDGGGSIRLPAGW